MSASNITEDSGQFGSLLRTAEQLKIKGLCEVGEPQYEQDYSPALKRYKPYRSRSPPDNRHQHHHHQQPPPPPPPPSGSSGTSSGGRSGSGAVGGGGSHGSGSGSSSNNNSSSSSQSTGYSENGKGCSTGKGGSGGGSGSVGRSLYHPTQYHHPLHHHHHHHPHLHQLHHGGDTRTTGSHIVDEDDDGSPGGAGGSVTPGPPTNNSNGNGGGPPAGGDEMKPRLNLKQENLSDGGADQQHQTMEVEQDQSSMHGMVVTPEISGIMNQSQMSDMYQSDASEDSKVGILDGSSIQYTNLTSPNEAKTPTGPKTWTAEDMESALEALRSHNMSLTKASATYGIPSTTLWQRAHRLGIDTPKKEGPSKTWNEDSLNSALEALRTGTISANKASKAFGIPSSTLYKIARREGIRLAAPFNAAPTTWSAEDLDRALEAIRAGQTSVQKASTEFGIPTGTLYGRCKREGIELSRSNPTPWSEDAMMEALESVKQGHMSINQAAIHYNLPYSSLYGRFKRGKYDTPSSGGGGGGGGSSSNAAAAAAATGGGGGGGTASGGSNGGANATSAGTGGSNVGGSPQMEFKIEPQHNDHSPENTRALIISEGEERYLSIANQNLVQDHTIMLPTVEWQTGTVNALPHLFWKAGSTEVDLDISRSSR
uniref:HTH psq-type domain-containing protein n=1 Tax=Anopheles culicifacies TaxID=139723 RepID=A0A182MKL3_9DIPT